MEEQAHDDPNDPYTQEQTIEGTLRMLRRYHAGERQVWQVVSVSSVEAEDQRHLRRDGETLKQKRAKYHHPHQGVTP